jgi:probable F420-dependent oxidoreductase
VEHGIAAFVTDYGIAPVELARAVEERGFESLFVTEHTHIPTSRATPRPGGGELPPRYSHTYDPFAALAAMAAVTERVTLGTAVCLVNQHHPLNLAKQVASVDRIACGRFEFGVGPGWNVEEMAHHGVNPRRRTAEMLERLDALRVLWTADEPEFHGEVVSFDPVWSYPKPSRVPPVLIAGGGPTVLDRVLSHGDGWIPLRVPVDGLEDFGRRVGELQARAADAGRGRIPVTVYGGAKKAAALQSYRDAGVDRLLFELADPGPDGDATSAVLSELDTLAGLARGQYG